MQKIWLLIVMILLVFGSSVQAQQQETLIVFAAASLTDAFEEVGRAFEAENGAVRVIFNFAGSSTLAAQLAEGAPADVFASANNTQMNAAREAGRIGSAPRTFVKNRLVLVVPDDNPANITTLRDLANPGVLFVVAAPNVPVREYTDTMLNRLANDPAFGEDYRTAVVSNIVSEEDNVRQVAAKVALGEADAGVVYFSNVTPDIFDEVTIIPIPDYLNTIATYPIAITDDTANLELAQAFVDFVLSDTGQDILTNWNFISARIPEVPYFVTLPDGNSAVTVDGQVLNPLALTVESLQSDFSAQTIDVTYLSGQETVTTSFTGVPLWQIINAAQPNFDADVRNDRLSTFIVITGSDGYQAVISWGEIDPEFAGQMILIAYEQEGSLITDTQGPIRLVVSSDVRGGRYVSGVVNMSLRDAPRVGQ